jgi:EmrB/QacA subfamily drug resistance transporter
MHQTARTRRRGVLLVLSAAAFLASLDLFIVNVALDDIGHDVGGGALSDLSWILNAYAIVYAALLVPAGRLADRFGRKSGFLLGLAVFVLASAGCAVAQGLWTLVAFRAVQAAGAALLTPTSLGLLLAATPDAGKARAVRAWAASGSLAAALGPVVGGVLVEASWRWVFLVNLPFGVAALVAAWRIVPDSDHVRGVDLPDLVGGVVLIGAIGSLATALVRAPGWGWGSGRTLGMLAVSVVALLAFLARCRTHKAPIIALPLLRHRTFAWSNATAVLFSAAFAANLLAMVLWCETVWGWSALRTGLAVAPGPLMVPVFAAVGHRLTARIPVGVVTAAGSLLLAVGSVLVLTTIGTEPSYATELLPGWLVGGVGVGLALPTILSSATSGLPAADAATGSAIVNMGRQIGAVLGISVLVAVIAGGAPADFRHAWEVVAGIGVAGAVTALRTSPPRSEMPVR